MFSSVLILFFSALSVSGSSDIITVQPLDAPVSGGSVVIHWTPNEDVSSFSIELHHPNFNADFAIANNVNASAGEYKCDLPVVPATDGYTLELVNIEDITDVYGSSPEFSIAAPPSTSEQPTSTSTVARVSGTTTLPASVPASPAASGMSMSMPGIVSATSASASASSSAKHSGAAPLLAVRESGFFGASAVLVGVLSAAWIL
ncbi:hypothetical protein C8F01DRAFT_268644 [Mycena amicta]|nr:hypothetical protein C8F01DRAFT_268644 [Mycena amicta]